MNEELIRKIAEEILNQAILENYATYFLMLALALVSAASSAFLISYFQKRGKSFATKADFEDILNQLAETTRLSEEIKADIESKYQEEAGIKSLMRDKLELIMAETYELDTWLEQSRSNALNRTLPNTGESPLAKIEMYQAMYFSEVKEELLAVKSAYFPMLKFILDTAISSTNGELPKTSEFQEVYQPFLNSLTQFKEDLVEKYAANVGL